VDAGAGICVRKRYILLLLLALALLLSSILDLLEAEEEPPLIECVVVFDRNNCFPLLPPAAAGWPSIINGGM
jgi:hypothetical protein